MSNPNPMSNPTTEDQLSKLNRSMPHAIEAERGALSGMLNNPADLLSEARSTLPPAAFYHPAHRTIYETLLHFLDHGIVLDVNTLIGYLREKEKLDAVGGPAEISELYGFMPVRAHYDFYVAELVTKLKHRRLISVLVAELARAQSFGSKEGDGTIDGLISDVQQRIIDLDTGRSTDNTHEWTAIMADVIEEVGEVFRPGNTHQIPPYRLATGFTSFDRRTGGLEYKTLWVIAGRPSMGKTSFGMNIAENIALGVGHYKEFKQPKHHVIVFSLEMSATGLGRRSLVGGAGINLNNVRFGISSRGDLDKIQQRLKPLAAANITVIDCAGMSIQEMRARARVIAKKRGTKFILVDYLQLACSEDESAKKNRSIEIGHISKGLKAMAKETGTVVMALAQLNRNTEERRGGIPKLSDLREGGDIEQDADGVGMLHRPPYYDDTADEREAALHIVKGRDVGTGVVQLNFFGEATRFDSLTQSLLSNDPDERDAGYQSKPQASKQKPPAKTVQKQHPNLQPGQYMAAPQEEGDNLI
jgi:replicative DNA helicase